MKLSEKELAVVIYSNCDNLKILIERQITRGGNKEIIGFSLKRLNELLCEFNEVSAG